MLIDGRNFDASEFEILGEKTSNERLVRATQNTLSGDSRTATSIHKKRFKFSFVNLTEDDVQYLIDTFRLNSFVIDVSPFDSNSYTVKVINDGTIKCLNYTHKYYNWSNIEVEVI